MKKYTIILEPDPEAGGYTVRVPALPGCIIQGKTIEQCIERAREAIVGYIESLRAAGEIVPEETKLPYMITIDVATSQDTSTQEAEYMLKHEALVRLLQSRDEEDEQEQRETWEQLKRALDEDRPSERKLFP